MNTKNESMMNIKNLPSEVKSGPSSMTPVVSAALALWLGIVLLLGIQGAFVQKENSPPLPIFLGFAIPLVVFFATYFGSTSFRAFILSANLKFVTAIQAWRWAGSGFLTLYAQGILPGLFAFPAGLGDMAVGITAPWIVLGLVRHPSFATSRRYVIWNLLGILDLVTAVSIGAISSGFLRGLTGGVTTAPMARFPLVLIPAYLVPLFIMLHFTALFQARHLARSGK